MGALGAWVEALWGAAAAGADGNPGAGVALTPNGSVAASVLTSGASGMSAERTGRSLCVSDAALNCLAGVVGRASAGAAGSCSDADSEAAASLGAPVGLAAAGAGVPVDPAACCPGSDMGDGRVRRIRTDSLVVFDWSAPVTSIRKTTSEPEGEYSILPLCRRFRSISTFSCCAPSEIDSTARVAPLMMLDSRFHVSMSSAPACSTRKASGEESCCPETAGRLPRCSRMPG